ncbi:hypothetical protein S7335_5118 [Synechococcus sp. PCC 7335]|nr:hypothetical protein S7335_5118 [Synechococcus sp. PCC 7335]
MKILSKVLSFCLVLLYFYAPEIESISSGKLRKVVAITAISGAFIARNEILYLIRSNPYLSAVVAVLSTCLVSSYLIAIRRKQKTKRNRTRSHKIRRIYRTGLVAYQKALGWLYSSTPENYAEALEQIGYRAVNSKMRLFYLCAILPHTPLNYSSAEIFLAAACFFGVLCVGRVIQRYFFRVLVIAVLFACVPICFCYALFGYETTAASFLLNQPIAQQFILSHGLSEAQSVTFLCFYISSLFLFVAVFFGGALATVRQVFVKLLCLVKLIAVRIGLFRRQQRKSLQMLSS